MAQDLCAISRKESLHVHSEMLQSTACLKKYYNPVHVSYPLNNKTKFKCFMVNILCSSIEGFDEQKEDQPMLFGQAFVLALIFWRSK